MENIRQALERAKTQQAELQSSRRVDFSQRQSDFGDNGRYGLDGQGREIVLNSAYLRSNRIIAHIVTEPLSKPFDMLRTQILQAMDANDWKVLAITSPTPSCGKTITAVNLALSVARQPERSVLLVDLDLQRPNIGSCLGLEFQEGALGVLCGRATLASAITHVRVDNQRLMVLPTSATSASSEFVSSRAMGTMLQDLRKDFRSEIVIIDLPPVLSGDDVIAMLPQVDCVVLVVAVGTSTMAQIEECNRHLRSAEVIKVVLNKVPEASTNYYYSSPV
jgi:protein-tyrosine kinase